MLEVAAAPFGMELKLLLLVLLLAVLPLGTFPFLDRVLRRLAEGL